MHYTVTSVFEYDFRVKGSKFLGYLAAANNIEQATEALETVKSQHPTATHHCYGYIINPNRPAEFASDDGEPGGTAGLPILNALRSHHLMNVMLVVVRYYGSTKLGKAGLIEAYGETAEGTIRASSLKRLLSVKEYRIVYDYPQQNIIEKMKNNFTLIERRATYLEQVALEISIPVGECEQFEAAVSSLAHLLGEFKPGEFSFLIVE